MISISFTEFRRKASELISDVENGEVIQLIRHGKAVAEISPIKEDKKRLPSWKISGPRLVIKGDGLSKAILQERENS